jgi:uncharacterized protein (TIGR03067 family)
VDPGNKPAWIDLIVPGDEELQGYVNHAIYSLEGNRLIICSSWRFRPNTPQQRPIKFSTKREENQNLHGLVLSLYQRQKN